MVDKNQYYAFISHTYGKPYNDNEYRITKITYKLSINPL